MTDDAHSESLEFHDARRLPSPPAVPRVLSLSDRLAQAVADKLEKDPSLLRIPIENIDRWRTAGHTAPERLEQWRRILQQAEQSPKGLAGLLALLRDPSEAAVQLRSFDPFPGVLSTGERQQILLRCAYAH